MQRPYLRFIRQSFLVLVFFGLSASVSMAASPDARQPRQPVPPKARTTSLKSPPKSARSVVPKGWQWVRYTLLDGTVWPVTVKGNCWDSCWSTGKLPARLFFPYKHYLKNPNFKALTTGLAAPDIQVEFRIGKQLLKTKVLDNTTQPKWNLTRLWRVQTSSSWSVKVYDVDTFSRQLIGELKGTRLPTSWLKSGIITLRKFGQVESVRIKVFSLFPLKGTLPVAKAPARTRVAPPRKATPRKVPALAKQQPRKAPIATAKVPVVAPQKRRAAPRKAPVARQAPKADTVVTQKPVTARAPSKRAAGNTAPQARQAIPKAPVVRTAKTAAPRIRPLVAARPPPARAAIKPQPAVRSKAGKADQSKSATKTAKRPPARRKKPGILVLMTLESANISMLRKNGECWDTCIDKGEQKTLRQRWLNQLAPPDTRLRLRIGKQRWETKTLSNTTKPVWKQSWIVEVDPDDPVVLTVFEDDVLQSEKVGVYRAAALPRTFQTGGLWVLKNFGQVKEVRIRLKRLKRQAAPVATPTVNKLQDVQFVRVTLRRARVWPVDAKGQCWDTCPTTSTLKMPPRGLSSFKLYNKDQNFSSMNTGTLRPDPKVRIQLGNYDIFVSPTRNDTLQPVWNASYLFRLRGNEPLTLTVFDDDDNIAHDALRTYRPTRRFINQWWKSQIIGQYKSKRLPAVFLKGGRWILRSFGQVEMLELEVKPVQMIRKTPGCDGVYRVRVAELEIQPTRANGKPWHPGVGLLRNPSPYGKLWLGTQKLETTVAYKSLKAVYQNSRLVPIRKSTSLVLEVRDYSTGVGLSLDRKYKVPFLPLHFRLDMKKEASTNRIGQTAFLSVCKLLKKSKNGSIRLPAFGRVKSALLFFDKVEDANK